MSTSVLRRGRAGGIAAALLTVALATSACATSGGGSGGGASTDAQGRISLSVAASAGSIPGLPPIVAKEVGIFDKHGIDANVITTLRGGGPIMSALSSGTADVVAQTVSASATAKQQGSSVPLVSAQSAGVPYILVVGKGKAATPVATTGAGGWQETIKSLKGATISASGGGSAFDVILKGLFSDAGLAPTDFTNVNTTHGGPEVAALQNGQVDAVMADIGTALSLQSQAGGKAVLDMTKVGPDWLTQQAWSGFLTSQGALAKNPTLADKWQAAMADTQKWMQDPANKAELHRIATQVSKIPEDPDLDQALVTFSGLLRTSFTEKQVQTTIDFMTRTGQLQPQPVVKPADIVVPNVLGNG
jgi:ABC-type nitrate/sulfonate/bicarbonate transport system substrate-binding protein